MASTSQISWFEPPDASQITQLYTHLELYTLGEPPANTLFVLGRTALQGLEARPDQLLVVDPPSDASQRFKLDGEVAALFTSASSRVDLPLMGTRPGGVAHLRIGEHYLDIYSQDAGNVVVLPAVGLICGGRFGSDALPPAIAENSDGSEELETLRLLARLVKQHACQLYIPAVGALADNPVEVMTRLASDVGYLHGLRRVLSGVREIDSKRSEELVASLLPGQYTSELAQRIHRANVQRLISGIAP